MNSLNRWGLAALMAAAPAQAKVMEDTVAVVNGTPILLSEYQKELATSIEFWSRNEPEALRDPAVVRKLHEGTLEELINREILFQEGSKLKIKVRERDVENGIKEIKSRFLPEDPEGTQSEEQKQAQAEAAFKEQLKSDGLTYPIFEERLKKQIMARKLIDEAVRPKVRPPEEKDVRAYFDRIKAYILSKSTEAPAGMEEDESSAFRQISQQVRGMTSERVRVSRILVKISPGASENEKKRALKTASDIRARLIEGTSSFAEIARTESEDPESARRGGDIGYVLRGVAPLEFEKAAFSLPVGEISEPIETEIGYHILRVQEKRAAETPDYEDFKKKLGEFLGNVRFQKELEGFIKSLRAKSVVEKNSAALQQL